MQNNKGIGAFVPQGMGCLGDRGSFFGKMRDGMGTVTGMQRREEGGRSWTGICPGTDDSEGVLLSLRQKRYPRRRFFRQSGPKKSEPLAGYASKAFLDCVNGAPQGIPLLS